MAKERVNLAPAGHVWHPLTLEHINVTGEGPLTFRRKADLKAYCREHKVASGALL